MLGGFPGIMFRFLVSFLAFIHLVQGTTLKQIFSHRYDEKIAECYINKSNIWENCYVQISYYGGLYSYNYCYCWIKNNLSQRWDIKIIFERKSRGSIIDYVDTYNYTEVSALPGRYILAKVGKYVRIHMDQPSDNKNARCYLYHKGKWKYNMHRDFIEDDIEPYGKCGIQMRVSASRKGQWSLHQELDHGIRVAIVTIVIEGELRLNQPKPKLMVGEEFQIESKINRNVTITLEKPPGEIEQCYASHDDSKILVLSNNATPTNCSFTIAMTADSYYGKWTFTKVYRYKKIPHSFKLINNIYIYQSIKDEGAIPRSVIYAYENENIQVSSKNCASNQNTCRLIHKTSGMEYNLTLYSSPTAKIHLIDNACCHLEIKSLEQKQYGEWWIEKSFGAELKRSHFYIINPKNANDTRIDYPCKNC